jgi:type VI secretion system secreted protein VgrG
MNPTPLQKVKARLHFLTGKRNPHVSDHAYSIYQLHGENTLGSPYRYEVSLVSPSRLEVAKLVDTDVKLLLQDEKDPSQKREIYAKIYQAKEENKVADKYLYTLTVVHPLFYLGLNQRYEIFQDKSAYAIIQEILGRYKALLDLDFNTNIAPHHFIQREYTTQYKQSDLEFIQMLCEQEGVTLWSQSDTRPYKIRLARINETYAKLTTELRCHFTQSKTFAPTYAQEDYYDFRAPSKEYLSSTGRTPLSQSLSDNTHTSQLRHDLEVMTHRDRLEAPRPKDLQNNIKQTALKQYSNTEKIEGVSLSLYTEAGYGGVLFDHKSIKRTQAILTKVTLKGFFPNALEEYIQDESKVQKYLFEAHFEATPKETLFIPDYTITKPLIPGAVTAIVSSGSKNTESTPNTIDVDSFGRIRVIFHFDPNYPTSCYIRFANFSAGDGWGSQFIPRVNTEVIVNFLNGDPDRPIAIGSLYNGNNKIPKELSNNKTQSYIKTQSMPGDNSQYNLLLFEDKGGEELVHIRAQKDYKLHALHDSTINIDHDQSEVVGHDESFSVGNDRSKSIGHDETTEIGNDRTESVGQNETISIGKDQSLSVGHDQQIHIQHSQTTRVDQDLITYTGNQRYDEVYANHTHKVGGHLNQTVNGKVDVKAGEHIKEITKLKEMHGSERIVFKSKGGTIIIDGSGITLKGNVQIKGNVAITGGSPEAVAVWSAVANKGDAICWDCLLKDLAGDK